MNTPNFHALLSAINVPRLKAYLSNRGWNENTADGRLDFTKESAEGETQRVFVPADGAHPRFRSLLQNLMFSLSVIENREPADIAYEISKIEVPKVVVPATSEHQLHDIASHIRGMAQECVESEQAKGKLLELARFLLAYQSLSIAVTPKLADELWEVARSDRSYFPTATSDWLRANAKTSK
ncbi:MAG: hypothetical protein SFV81_13775 [Pirellulaceae bacterium]|nr:hypothetical protein [Pirellulaceae bacterium]